MLIVLRKFFAVTVLFASLPATTQAQVLSHCKSGEVEYFSCKLYRSSKIASLCGGRFDDATANLTEEMWLQYRFGAPGTPELVFPTEAKGSLSKFQGEYRHSLGVRLESVSFKYSGVTYTIESSSSNQTGYSFEGVRTSPNNRKKPSAMRCGALGQPKQFGNLADQLDPRPR